jgi:hypothetical protein
MIRPLVTLAVSLSLLASVAVWGEAGATPPATTPADTQSARPARSRFNIRTKAAVMGVRGLDEVELKAAVPDEKAVVRLESYAPTPAQLEDFARFRGKKLIPVDSGSVEKFKPEEVADEIRFGHDIAATILGGAELVDDPGLQHYVNLVGTWVALRSDRPDLKWHFGVIASDSVNAFAVPGGYVLITMGLYQKLHTEAELAGVIGHEITHIVARDHYNMLTTARALNAASDQIKKMMKHMPVFEQATRIALDQTVSVFCVALDKQAEVSADRKGMMLAADAGYEPFGLRRVLKVLAEVPRDDKRAELLFKTHPSPQDRLAAIAMLREGRFEAKAHDPDMKERFVKYDASTIRLVRRTTKVKPSG